MEKQTTVMEELEKAKKELGDKTEDKGGVVQYLSKAISDLTELIKGGKKKEKEEPEEEEEGETCDKCDKKPCMCDKEETKEEEDEEKSKGGMTEDMFKSLSENKDFVPIVEASKAIEVLTDVMAKGLGDIDEKMNSIIGMQIELAKSQIKMHEEMDLVKSGVATNPGVSFTTKKTEKMGNLSKGDIRIKLQELVQKGEADAGLMSRLDTQGISAIPQNIVEMLNK